METKIAVPVSSYSQQVTNALIEFGTAVSKVDQPENFSFPKAYSCNANQIAAALQIMTPGIKYILPVQANAVNYFTVDRNDSLSGENSFHWLSIGGLKADQFNFTSVTDAAGNVLANIQWGTAVSNTDSAQDFSFPKPFLSGCHAVLTNLCTPNASKMMPVTKVDTTKFTVDRNDDISGNQTFYWIAIGDCKVNSLGNFSFQLGDYVMKGGRASSTSDQSQPFPYKSMELTDFASEGLITLITRTVANASDTLPVTEVDKVDFTIDRNDDISGTQGFYWVSIGK